MSACSLNYKTIARAPCFSWLLGFSLLSYCGAYVIVNSVSWSVTNEVEEELDSSSTEDALPSLLEDTISMWKQSYPASVYKEDKELKSGPGPDIIEQISSPSRMFSYKRETESPPSPAAAFQTKLATSARTLAHQCKWGVLASISSQEMIQGLPFGQVLLTSDGPLNNSTGVPLFYVTPKASFFSDLMKNPVASFTFADPDGDVSRKALAQPQEPQCAALTLIGQMVTVLPDFDKYKHPDMQKWSQDYNCLLMKLIAEHIYVSDCYGGVHNLSLEDYYRVNPI
ncbi:PREDICTED: protein CREG2 [Nanorana parkeri]|uniref:protein CREG2 n=1 Tax=Nanorana parkeri TaxID=125878 RepID=UPI000853F998|nr:PREDICTED: protein CREG2 [Nanorana parkeri]